MDFGPFEMLAILVILGVVLVGAVVRRIRGRRE